MTVYRLVFLLHVFSALWVAVAAFGGTVLRASLKQAPDLAARVAVMRVSARIGKVFGFGGGLAVGMTGLALAFSNSFYMRQAWVHASIALWVVLFSVNVFVMRPRLERLLAAGEASLAAGAPSEEFKRLAANPVPRVVADLPPVAVVIFVILMVLKPF